jgi:hypothetical protein
MQMTQRQNQKATAIVLMASLLTIFLVGVSPLPKLLAAAPAAAATLSPVQLSIQTENFTSVSSYDLVAYNSTGAPVASYTGQYPEVTLDLPSGTYLFAAVVDGPAQVRPPVCCACAQPVGAAASSTAKAAPGASSVPAIVLPCVYGNPPEEYGYSLTNVSGPTSVTIDAQPPSNIPTKDVSVAVSFKNGTAVSGADVSASVVGADLNWGANSNLTMYAQTSSNGVAQLVVPAVPLVVTASDSVQVNLTQSQTIVQVNVGGQPVNVTVYYSPNYVYLSASSLLIPPSSSLSMVLSVQAQPQLVPYAMGSAAQTASPDSSPATSQGTAGASGSASTTSSEIASIPPIPESDVASATTAPSSSGLSGVSLMAIGTLATAGALAAVVGVAISKKR